jgi:hypothetical protein
MTFTNKSTHGNCVQKQKFCIVGKEIEHTSSTATMAIFTAIILQLQENNWSTLIGKICLQIQIIITGNYRKSKQNLMGI